MDFLFRFWLIFEDFLWFLVILIPRDLPERLGTTLETRNHPKRRPGLENDQNPPSRIPKSTAPPSFPAGPRLIEFRLGFSLRFPLQSCLRRSPTPESERARESAPTTRGLQERIKTIKNQRKNKRKNLIEFCVGFRPGFCLRFSLKFHPFQWLNCLI